MTGNRPSTIDDDQLRARLDLLAGSPFRARQKLNREELAYLRRHGLEAVRGHARRFIIERLAPAAPPRDGRQTPWHGHPVFVAQHATATCCRKCLARWHHIPAGHALGEQQISYVVAIIAAWLARHVEDVPPEPQLFA